MPGTTRSKYPQSYKVSPRIYDVESIKYLKKNFKTKTYGAQKALEIFPYVREIVLDGLKGIFKESELSYLIEAFRLEKIPDFLPSTRALKNKIEYTEEVTNLSSQKGVSFPEFSERIDRLTDLESIFLSEWLTTFIYFKGKVKEKEFIKRLVE